MLGKKRGIVESCVSCNRGIRRDQKVCECGTATSFMSFDERREHEVAQWRRYQQSATATG